MKHAKENKLSKITNDIIFNVLYIKIFFIITSFGIAIPIARPYFGGILKIGIIWGVLFFIRDFFTRKNILKMNCIKPLILFMIAYAISVFINYANRLSVNFSTYIYNFIMIFVLFCNINRKNKVETIKEMRIVNYVFITLAFICSAISLFLFIIQYSSVSIYQGNTYYIGMFNNRLFGIYVSPNWGISALAVCIGVLQFIIEKNKSYSSKIYIILTIICNALCMLLENSRGVFISILAFFTTVVLLMGLRNNKKIRHAIKYVTIVALIIVLLVTAGVMLRKFLSYVHISNNNLQQEKVELDRKESANYGILNGRTEVWEYGMNKFKSKPIFGWGPKTFSDKEFLRENSKLTHFHNILIQSLVSTGVFGTVMFLIAIASILIFIVKEYKNNEKKSIVTILLIAFIAFSIVNNFSEVTIMYTVTLMTFLFWIYLGYLKVMVKGEEKNVCNTK